MAINSSIEWTESTWNPITGCNKISPGCKHCYAERMAFRLQRMGQPNYANGFKLTLQEQALELPLHWKKPQTIFVNSMSDLFHKDVPEEFIKRLFDVMKRAHWHRFQILTKRSERLLELNDKLDWQPNIWMGVSVENQDYTDRIDDLRKTDAFVKFLSLEPLLGPLRKLKLKNIGWVIVGGESGPGARLIEGPWVLDIRDQCVAAMVPFFFKQWGGVQKKKAGRILEGKTWSQMPKIKRAG
jgi:protein gp37